MRKLTVALHGLSSGGAHSMPHSPEEVVQCLHRIHFRQECTCVQVLGHVRVLPNFGFVRRMGCKTRVLLGHLLWQSEIQLVYKNA